MSDQEKVAEIIRLLDEAYKHWDELSDDRHCKSAEGGVTVHYGNYFDRKDGRSHASAQVYSYLFGPSRLHDFDTLDEALKAVQEWHATEMANTYDPLD